MAEEAVRTSRLGRGLAALIGDVGEETAALDRTRSVRKVPVEFLRPNPRNPRKVFTEEHLEDLANSLREKGIVQPILVRTVPGEMDAYEIIAGERRWRAAQKAGMHDVPVLLVEVSDREALELAIIENVQRADLNAIEEAAGYDMLIAQYGYAQADLARIVGKSRSHIANMLRLLKLPEEVKTAVQDGRLTAGHARALLTVDNPAQAAKQIMDRGLTVRQAEALGHERDEEAGRPSRRRAVAGDPVPAAAPETKSADIRLIERQLADLLGLEVELDHRGEAGELRIRYRTLEQLEAVLQKLRS